jgi:hypothetical protein
MKTTFFMGLIAMALCSNSVTAQDIHPSEVPSVIVNNFQKAFPKATDVEWELDGANYKVEFETGLFGQDHDVWYDQNGKLIRRKEEISKSDVPQKVMAAINRDFKDYRIDDVKKITEGNKLVYTLELKSFREEWKVAFDSEGKLLSKIAD